MLFQWDITHDSIDQVAATFFQNQPEESEIVVEFARQLVMNTVEHVEQIDEFIRRHAEHWRLDRMATVDRNILRLAAYEMLHLSDIPTGASINEAVELAKKYSTAESGRFVNGVLGALAGQKAD